MSSRVVIAFGSFDPFHKGHRFFLRQAKECGDSLIVVVARDSAIRAVKHREPYQHEQERVKALKTLPMVDRVIMGNEYPHYYDLLSQLEFDVVALGYDQEPADTVIHRELKKRGNAHVQVVRLKPYKPRTYKSTQLRKTRLANM